MGDSRDLPADTGLGERDAAGLDFPCFGPLFVSGILSKRAYGVVSVSFRKHAAFELSRNREDAMKLLLISDIHANLEALVAVLADARAATRHGYAILAQIEAVARTGHTP